MTDNVDWTELHRLNRVWRAWMDEHSKFVTPAQTSTTLQYASGETREAKREYRLMHAELLAEYLLEVAPVGTKAALDAADDCAHKAMDLWIREQMPEHARNSKRNRTICQELAQVVMLILTALPEIRHKLSGSYNDATMTTICDIANKLVVMHDELEPDNDAWVWDAHILMGTIAIYPGVNVEADLRQCWWQLARKHASQCIGSYPEELKPNE